MTMVSYVVVLILVFNVVSSNKRLLKTESYPTYTNMVEMSGAIRKTTAVSLIGCVSKCVSNDKCLTIFFNSKDKQCVLHSKHFYYQPPSTTQNGWKYYIVKEDTGRCPPPYLYYRNIDLCYTFDEIVYIDSNIIKAICSQRGGQLASVNSQVKYEYFVHILENRTHERVFLQGKRVNVNQWMLDDGTPLNFLNWFPGEPDNVFGEDCLELKDEDKLQNICCSWPYPAVFICER